jgi:hypothetical protein
LQQLAIKVNEEKGHLGNAYSRMEYNFHPCLKQNFKKQNVPTQTRFAQSQSTLTNFAVQLTALPFRIREVLLSKLDPETGHGKRRVSTPTLGNDPFFP